MANVLPPEYRRALAHDYALRVVIVGALIIAVAFVIGSASLVPAYFSSRTMLLETQQYYDLQEDTREVTRQDSAVVQARFVQTQLSTLDAMAPEVVTPFVYDVLEDWELHAADIIISSIAYGVDDGARQLRISGEARNRETLSAFVSTLRKNPVFARVTLPVSDLVSAQETTFSVVVVRTDEQ